MTAPETRQVPPPRAISEAASEVLAALDDPRSTVVTVAGPSGAGRSTVLRLVVETLRERGVPVTMAQESPTVSAAGPVPVIVVDDIHRAEPAVVAAVGQAGRSGRARVLTSVLDGADVGPGVLQLWQDVAVRTVRCHRLGVLGVADVLAGLLGGPVAGETAARVHRDTGGVLALVSELGRRAMTDGAFECDARGRHHLSRQPSTPWSTTVNSLIGAFPPPVRTLLQVLAVADGPVLAAVATRLAGPDAVQRGVAMGMVDPDAAGLPQRLVHTSAWVASGLRAVEPSSTTHATLRRLGELTLAQPDLCDADLLRGLQWALSGGAATSPQLLRAGVAAACRQGDVRAADLLVEVADVISADVSAQLATVRMLARQPPPPVVPRDRGGTPGGDGRAAATLIDRALALYLNRGRFDESERLVGALIAVLPGGSNLAASVSALRCALLLSRGRTTAAVAASDSLRCDRVETLAIRLACLMYAGRPVDAVRAAQATTQFDRSQQRYAHFRHVAHSSAAVASAYAGGLPAARARARRQYETALLEQRPLAAASWGLALGSIHQLGGDTDAAIAPLVDAAAVMEQVQTGIGPAGHVMVLGLLAGLHAQAGDTTQARATLEWAAQVMKRPEGVPTVLTARALLARAEGDVPGSAVLFHSAARQSVTQGSYLYAAWAYLELACSGRAGDAARGVKAVSRQLQGPALAAICDLIRALATGSPQTLTVVTARLQELGMLLDYPGAPWAGRGGAGSRAGAGPRPGAEDVWPPAEPVTALPVESLTMRQREVTQLVADGLSNAEVAQRLNISRRTVEVHLQLAYDKLGVHDRRALVAASSATGAG